MKYLSFFAILASLVFQNYATAAAPAGEPEKICLTGAALDEYVQRHENHTFIDSSFLKGYSVSGVLDLSRLTKIKHLGPYFLCEQRGLTEIILPPNMINIGETFLQSCTGLTTIDLSPLAHVEKVQFGFLFGCTGLTTIDLSPLKQVTKIKGSFLTNCKGLTTIDLSPLTQVTEIGEAFLEGCTGLRTVIFPTTPAFTNVQFPDWITEIKTVLIVGDGRLKFEDPSVRHIISVVYDQHEKFSYIERIDLKALSNVERICPEFLARCARLGNVDLSPLENVVEIGDGFLSDCRSLESLSI